MVLPNHGGLEAPMAWLIEQRLEMIVRRFIILIDILIGLADHRYADLSDDATTPYATQSMFDYSSDVNTNGGHFTITGRPSNAGGRIDDDSCEDFA